MKSVYERLLEFADSTMEGERANEEMWKLRGALEARYGRASGYEIVIDPSVPWDEFLDRFLPRMSEHFHAKGLPPFGDPSVQVAVWHGSQAHIFTADRFFLGVSTVAATTLGDLELRLIELRRAMGLEPSPWKRTPRLIGTAVE